MDMKIRILTSSALAPSTTNLGTNYLGKNKRIFASDIEAYTYLSNPINPTTTQLNSTLFLKKEITQHFSFTYNGVTTKHRLVIQKNFTYDGASVIPLIRKLFARVSRLGFAFHDWNYVFNNAYNQLLAEREDFLDDMEAMSIDKRVAFQRLVADKYMLANFKYRGVDFFKQYITYWGVRIGAGKAFKAHRRNNLRP